MTALVLVIHSYESLVNFILNCDQVDVLKINHEFCFSMFPVSNSLFQLFADIRLVLLFRYAECAARHVPGCKRFYFELFLEMRSFLYWYAAFDLFSDAIFNCFKEFRREEIKQE